MLRIEIDGEGLDLQEDLSLSMTLTSPLSGDNSEIKGSSIYNFQIPASDNNKRIFGFPNRIEKLGKNVVEKDCIVILNGVQWIDGIIKGKQSSNKQLESVIGMSSACFANMIKGKSLKDLDYDKYHSYGGYGNPDLKYPDQNFAVFPIKDENYFTGIKIGETDLGDVFSQNVKYINYWGKQRVGPVDGWRQWWDVSGEPPVYNVIIPFPYVSHIINQLFLKFSYRLTENKFETDKEFNEIVLVGLQTINKRVTYPDLETVFPVPGGLAPSFWIYLKNHVPDEAIEKFLISLGNTFGFGIFINNNRREAKIKFLRDIINDTEELEWSDKLVGEVTIVSEEADNPGFEFSFELAAGDNYINTKIQDIEEVNLKDSVEAYEDLPLALENEVGDVRLVRKWKKYYIWDYDENIDDLNWIFYSDLTQAKFRIEGDSNKVESYISPILTAGDADESIAAETNRIWKIPIIDQVGKVTNITDMAHNSYEPRILFYKGMVKDNNDKDYPFGTNEGIDWAGNILPNSSFALRWESTASMPGLYETFWKDWVEWFLYRKKDCKAYLQLTVADIANLDFSKKIRIRNNVYLIKEIRGNVTMQGMEVMEADLWKV